MTHIPPFETAKRHFLDGMAAIERGEFAAAEEHLQASLGALPGRISTLTNLAAAQIKLRKYEEARANASVSVELDAENALGWMNVGIASMYLGHHEASLNAFDRALELQPGLAEALTNKGALLGRLRRHEEAIPLHDAAIAAQPGFPEPWYNKATALSHLGLDA